MQYTSIVQHFQSHFVPHFFVMLVRPNLPRREYWLYQIGCLVDSGLKSMVNSYKKEHLISIHTYNLIGKLKFLGLFWRNVLKEGEKERLVENIGNDLSKAQKFIQVKIVPIAQSNFNIDGDKRTNDGCFWRTNEMIDAIGTSYNFGKP